MLEAGREAFIYMQNNYWTGDTPLVICGMCLGSQIAARLAAENQEKISALVLDSGMSSFTEMAKLYAPAEVRPYVDQFVPSPYSALEDVKVLESTPLLIIHGKQDEVVPFEQAVAVYLNAPDPKALLEYDGGHTQLIIKEKQRLFKAIETLLNN